jgi:hypothetical protein
MDARFPDKAGSTARPSTNGAGGANRVATGCRAGVEPTWQMRQVAADAALECVCHRPVADAAISTARNAALNNSNTRNGLERLRRFMAVVFTSNKEPP